MFFLILEGCTKNSAIWNDFAQQNERENKFRPVAVHFSDKIIVHFKKTLCSDVAQECCGVCKTTFYHLAAATPCWASRVKGTKGMSNSLINEPRCSTQNAVKLQQQDLHKATYRALFLSQSCIDHALKDVFLQCNEIMCITKTTVYKPPMLK